MRREIRYRAPENSTQLAALEGVGVLGAEIPDPFSFGWKGQAAEQAKTPGTWDTIGTTLTSVLQSQEVKSLIDAGMTLYSSKNDRQYAEEQAKIARQNAALQEQMAQAEIKASRKEQKRLEQLAQLQQQQARASTTPQPSGGGMPGWALPAIGGVALVMVITMTKLKKK